MQDSHTSTPDQFPCRLLWVDKEQWWLSSPGQPPRLVLREEGKNCWPIVWLADDTVLLRQRDAPKRVHPLNRSLPQPPATLARLSLADGTLVPLDGDAAWRFIPSPGHAAVAFVNAHGQLMLLDHHTGTQQLLVDSVGTHLRRTIWAAPDVFVDFHEDDATRVPSLVQFDVRRNTRRVLPMDALAKAARPARTLIALTSVSPSGDWAAVTWQENGGYHGDIGASYHMALVDLATGQVCAMVHDAFAVRWATPPHDNHLWVLQQKEGEAESHLLSVDGTTAHHPPWPPADPALFTDPHAGRPARPGPAHPATACTRAVALAHTGPA